MKVEKIRPTYLIREYEIIKNKEIKKILNHRNSFIEVSCPACESDSIQFLFRKNDFVFVSCKSCETVFINPRPDIEILKDFYMNSKLQKFWNKKILASTEDYRRSRIIIPRAKKVIDLCKKHRVPSKLFVDVGAGLGTFCEEISKFSIFDNIIAVEPSSYLAEICRTIKNVNVIEKIIENVDLDEASVITSFELIEHLFCPKDFLSACYNKLRGGGE